jgi:hypothetical protein
LDEYRGFAAREKGTPMKNKKRVGFVLACVGMIAALLFEPVNGRKRRGRLGRALEPASRPLQAMRARLTKKVGEESGEGAGATLVDRLQHVAIRAQGKIDLPDGDTHVESETYAGNRATQDNDASLMAEGPKSSKRRKKTGPAE